MQKNKIWGLMSSYLDYWDYTCFLRLSGLDYRVYQGLSAGLLAEKCGRTSHPILKKSAALAILPQVS
jgi:hypothetical protein